MNDYEKMRKMNDLAKDLKLHGFAESSFEAIKQANQIYGDDDLTHEVKHGLINSPHERIVGEEKMSETDFDKKFKKLQDNVDTLTNKMNEMIQALNDMDARIAQMSKKQREERVVPREEAPVHREEKPVENNHEEQTHHEAKPHSESGEYENQRVGNYQSQDVNIDKIFYYGKK